jgi:hypothetical protein
MVVTLVAWALIRLERPRVWQPSMWEGTVVDDWKAAERDRPGNGEQQAEPPPTDASNEPS